MLHWLTTRARPAPPRDGRSGSLSRSETTRERGLRDRPLRRARRPSRRRSPATRLRGRLQPGSRTPCTPEPRPRSPPSTRGRSPARRTTTAPAYPHAHGPPGNGSGPRTPSSPASASRRPRSGPSPTRTASTSCRSMMRGIARTANSTPFFSKSRRGTISRRRPDSGDGQDGLRCLKDRGLDPVRDGLYVMVSARVIPRPRRFPHSLPGWHPLQPPDVRGRWPTQVASPAGGSGMCARWRRAAQPSVCGRRSTGESTENACACRMSASRAAATRGGDGAGGMSDPPHRRLARGTTCGARARRPQPRVLGVSFIECEVTTSTRCPIWARARHR